MNDDVRSSLKILRNLIKEVEEGKNIIDISGKANLQLKVDGINPDANFINELKTLLEEFVDTIDPRITDFQVVLGGSVAQIKTAIDGNSVQLLIDLLAGDTPNEQITFTTVGPVQIDVIDKLSALRGFLNPKRIEFLINAIKAL